MSSVSETFNSNFNPRPPRGGRPSLSFDASPICFISIHALREESDAIDLLPNLTPEQFQSTPSARRATGGTSTHHLCMTISIHALREEGDFHPR